MTNSIHPTVIIEGDVTIGDHNEILPYSVLVGPLRIGDNNWIGPHVSIGTPGQDTRAPRYDSSSALIEIGDGNIIREYTAIQKPCYGSITRLGHRCFLMQGVHVPHDAVIEDGVVISPLVAMGGLVHLMEGANLGISCSVHQRSIIGAYAIVAMGAPVLKNVRPFSRYIPGKPISVNNYALQKFGFLEEEDEITAYVLSSVSPQSSRIRAIVGKFDALHAASLRGLHE